jgi:hypothetical protein
LHIVRTNHGDTDVVKNVTEANLFQHVPAEQINVSRREHATHKPALITQ